MHIQHIHTHLNRPGNFNILKPATKEFFSALLFGKIFGGRGGTDRKGRHHPHPTHPPHPTYPPTHRPWVQDPCDDPPPAPPAPRQGSSPRGRRDTYNPCPPQYPQHNPHSGPHDIPPQAPRMVGTEPL